ncbi:MAG: AhpC/TSA family protein [Pedobacter sp.]|nr:MAG: AhpC/TSA family protein [Pedobacter sp.]
MRYFFLLFAFCQSLNSFAQDSKNSYTITGTLLNYPAKSVYIKVMVRDSGNIIRWPIIDSAEVKNNKFILHKDTILSDPAWATSFLYKDSLTKKLVSILFVSSKFTTAPEPVLHSSFTLENAIMHLEGDLIKSKGVKLTGSKQTNFMMEYGLIPTAPLTRANKTIDSLKGNANAEELAKAKHIRDQVVDGFRQKIIQDPSSWVTMLSIYQSAKRFEIEELEIFSKIFTQEILETTTGKNFLTYINQRKALTINQTFLDFNYVDVNNKRFTLNDVKGKNGTLVIFWASWCIPCREEIPQLKEFHKINSPKGISLVSVSTDQSKVNWKKAVSDEKMPWTNLSNLPNDYKTILSKYNIQSIPAMFLLDKDNKIVLANFNDLNLLNQKVALLVK